MKLNLKMPTSFNSMSMVCGILYMVYNQPWAICFIYTLVAEGHIFNEKKKGKNSISEK